MAFQFTYTTRFQKHYKHLSTSEKKQLRKKLELYHLGHYLKIKDEPLPFSSIISNEFSSFFAV